MLKSKYYKQAFEIENIHDRKNYSFVYDPFSQSVVGYNTSINTTPRNSRMMAYKDKFPFECKTAYEYFEYLYNKSVDFSEAPHHFIGWVTPYNFQPIEYEYEERQDEEWEINLKSKLIPIHNKFLRMIHNEEIKKLIEDDCYISGGSISSLIRGEKPKDIDYFISNKESEEKIKEYFKRKYEIRKEYEKEHHRPITVLNGFDDVPLFFTENAVTLCDNFQIIFKDYGDPEEVCSRFDFVHCMGFYIPKSDELNVTIDTKLAAENKNLIFNITCSSPISSSYRMVKLLEKGWKINRNEHSKLLININKYELSQLEEDSMSDITYYDVE